MIRLVFDPEGVVKQKRGILSWMDHSSDNDGGDSEINGQSAVLF